MNRHADTNVWNDPRSYLPDCFDQLATVHHYEKLARQARRKVGLQRRVRAFRLAAAVFAIVYFGGRELLAVLP